MDNTRRLYGYVHLKLSFCEFDTIVCERNLEELVLSNENDVVVLCRVKFARGICLLVREQRCMETIQT